MVELRKLLPRSVGVAAIIGVSFAFGVVAGAESQPSITDWLSFAGALIGAAVTVAGSIYVLDRERGREERERRHLLLSLLDEADAACVPFQVANENALRERYGRTAMEQAQELQAAIRRIQEFREHLEPNSVRMMKAADAITELELDDNELETAATAAMFYPDSADFGHLNAIGHRVQGVTARVRAFLTD